MKLMFVLQGAVAAVFSCFNVQFYLKEPEIILLSRICGTTLKRNNKFLLLLNVTLHICVLG